MQLRQQVSTTGSATTILIASVALAMLPLLRNTVFCDQQQASSQLEQAQSTENRLESRQQKAGSDDLTATIDYLDRMDKLLQMSRPRFGRSEYKQATGAAPRRAVLESLLAASMAPTDSPADSGSLASAASDQWRPVAQWRQLNIEPVRANSLQRQPAMRQHQSLQNRYKPMTVELGDGRAGSWAQQQRQLQRQFDDAIEVASMAY